MPVVQHRLEVEDDAQAAPGGPLPFEAVGDPFDWEGGGAGDAAVPEQVEDADGAAAGSEGSRGGGATAAAVIAVAAAVIGVGVFVHRRASSDGGARGGAGGGRPGGGMGRSCLSPEQAKAGGVPSLPPRDYQELPPRDYDPSTEQWASAAPGQTVL